MNGSASDREAIRAELARSRAVFASLASGARPADLRRSTVGTRWTNQRLLFHMLFGYLILMTVLRLVRTFWCLPGRYRRRLRGRLERGQALVPCRQLAGSCGGAVVFRGPHLVARFDRTVASLHRHLDKQTDAALVRAMHFPIHWDPYFADRMTLADVYHYGTPHFDHHVRQLTLPREPWGAQNANQAMRCSVLLEYGEPQVDVGDQVDEDAADTASRSSMLS